MAITLDFLRAIAAQPNDEALRYVFADWLEEQGDWRAEFVRLDCELAEIQSRADTSARNRWRELRKQISPSWLTVLGRSNVENCKSSLAITFRRPCPQRWELLRATDSAAVRYCENCHRNVHYCGTMDEAREHAELGNCVAVDVGVNRTPGDLSSEFDIVLGELA
jgi:uncharacterized protein (TIGR02996 family)